MLVLLLEKIVMNILKNMKNSQFLQSLDDH